MTAPWTFIAAADMQVGSPKSFRYAPAWVENWETAKRQICAAEPDLLLVPGDITRDGSIHRYELETMREDFDALPFPVHVVAGNMDTGNKHAPRQGPDDHRDDVALNITSEQLRRFADVFGPLQWSVVHKGVRFSGFCDMVLGSGLPEEAAFRTWADELRETATENRHVWIMHYAPFIDDPREKNIDISKDYTGWYFGVDDPHRTWLMELFADTKATVVVSGHIHCRRTQIFDGIRFDKAPAVAFSQWGDRWEDGDDTLGVLRYDVTDDDIACSFVPLDHVSDATGYGPGGHPKPEARDYSIALEPGGDPAQA